MCVADVISGLGSVPIKTGRRHRLVSKQLARCFAAAVMTSGERNCTAFTDVALLSVKN